MKEDLALFLDYISVEKGLSKNTLSAYRQDLMKYTVFLKKNGISSFEKAGRKDIMDFLLNERDKSLKPSSVSRELVSIRMIHRFLAQEGRIKEDVTDVLEAPKLWKHLPEVLNVGEVELLLRSPNLGKPQGVRDQAVLELMYATGLRASEVVTLKAAHVNFDLGYIRVIGKGEKERIVPLG